MIVTGNVANIMSNNHGRISDGIGSRRVGAGNGNNNHRPRNNNRNSNSRTDNSHGQNQDSNNGQNYQGNRRGNFTNRNRHNDNQERSNGGGNSGPNENYPSRHHNEDSNAQNHQQKYTIYITNDMQLIFTVYRKFDGPIFGFTRLFNFLNADPNEVISNIFRNLKEWEILLEQDSIATMKTLRNGQQEMSDDFLVLIVTLLAEKILSDTIILESKQVAIISSSASCRNFLFKIDNKCRTYMMQDGDVVLTKKRKIGAGAAQNE